MQEQDKKQVTEQEIFLEFFKDWGTTVTITASLYPDTKSKNHPVIGKYKKIYEDKGYLIFQSIPKETKRGNSTYFMKQEEYMANANHFFEAYPDFTKREKNMINIFLASPFIRSKLCEYGKKDSLTTAFERVLRLYFVNHFMYGYIGPGFKIKISKKFKEKMNHDYDADIRKLIENTRYDYVKLCSLMAELEGGFSKNGSPQNAFEVMPYTYISRMFNPEEIMEVLRKVFREDFIVSEVIPFMVKTHAESKVVKLK